MSNPMHEQPARGATVPGAEPPGSTPGDPKQQRLTAMCAVDIYERKEGFVILAELPGLRRKELHYEIANSRVLRIWVDQAPRRTPGEVLHRERVEFDSQREFLLPDPVKPEPTRVSLRRGLLRIDLERTDSAAWNE